MASLNQQEEQYLTIMIVSILNIKINIDDNTFFMVTYLYYKSIDLKVKIW